MNPLNCKIKGRSIVISVGLDVLKFATENHPELYDGEKDRGRYRVKKISVFAKEVVSELHQEEEGGWPIPKFWLGVSVEDQQTADERIPILLQVPAMGRRCFQECLTRQS